VLSNWSSQDGWLETKIRLPLLQEKFFSKQTSSIIPRFLGILKNRNTEATAKMQLKTKPVFLKELNSFFISCNGALETSSGERPKDNSSVSSCQGGLSAIFTTSRKGVYTPAWLSKSMSMLTGGDPKCKKHADGTVRRVIIQDR